MNDYESAIERIIREAMEEGKFDNLPGKGKPLNLSGESDGDMWAANHLLKKHGFAPEWIEDRKEIMAKIDEARRAAARSWAWREAALQRGERFDVVAAQWRKAEDRFREAVEAINQRIRGHNLKTPASHLQLDVLEADRELRRIREGR
ncbi:MAG TPA: DUF1992 domain-containing protein [Aggregatilineales bacterium]|nr:DUF1992 domain-containing protein [Aggregatilineales bacterium]HQA68739.1 DUF1992 domain-containing protein [Aggregatilineales bacterium]HQE17409.1 DUF1992 domain-containing protein [Aggregatilineales bacterium]